MTIVLNHIIVPARDKVVAARFFADIFGLPFNARSGHFAPVRVNDSLTFLFDDDASFDSHHDAFHVSDAEFESIFERIKQAGLAYGSAPWSLDDGKLNDWNGGRGVYFKDPNGHVLELMTVPQWAEPVTARADWGEAGFSPPSARLALDTLGNF
jgi:catechol 2,3-dioxygenase-like lactoylglutathione lyase family enzyme